MTSGTSPFNPDGEKIGEIFRFLPSSLREYHRTYHASIEHRNEYWRLQAGQLVWDAEFTEVVSEDFTTASITWFAGGRLNGCRNALHRHMDGNGAARTALIHFTGEGEISYSYGELGEHVRSAAGALAAGGFKPGDRAAVYMPDRPETVIFMLACSWLGIIYVPIPYHFTAEITTEIIHDSGASLLLTDSSGSESYAARVAEVSKATGVTRIIDVSEKPAEGAVSYRDFVKGGNAGGAPPLNGFESEHPLFLIYANSATGIPRGSVFATGGYLVQASSSFRNIFLSNRPRGEETTVACTIPLASAAGQSYGFWGPLLNGGAVLILRDGISVESLERASTKHSSCALLASPRLLTSLKRDFRDTALPGEGRFSLVACCGDVLSPRLIKFAGSTLTTDPDNVINLWIQSESGTALINTFPNRELNRPGALGMPSLGCKPDVLNTAGGKCRTNESGQLVFETSWPGMVRTIWGQHERFIELYFRRRPGYFMTNDAVRVDHDGFFWFMGRLDDVVKVRGQSLATSEIEAVIVTHPAVREAAVVSIPREDTDGLVAFVSLERGILDPDDESELEKLEAQFSEIVTRRIGEFALPGRFIYTDELPRTRSGKLVRRVLRRIAAGSFAPDEDLSHIANPESVEKLVKRK